MQLLFDGQARLLDVDSVEDLRASELLERPADAGTDFGLTEVVHCKSPAELGVAEAYATCVQT